MVPVTARVARARAAILVLIDIRNSIRLWAAIVVRMPVGRRLFDSGSKRAWLTPAIVYSLDNTIT